MIGTGGGEGHAGIGRVVNEFDMKGGGLCRLGRKVLQGLGNIPQSLQNLSV